MEDGGVDWRNGTAGNVSNQEWTARCIHWTNQEPPSSIADSGLLFEKLKSAKSTKFLPSIFCEAAELDETIRGLTCLPAKYCSIGVPNPVTNSTVNYETSTLALSHLNSAIQGNIPFNLVDHETVCKTTWSAYIILLGKISMKSRFQISLMHFRLLTGRG